ncbi:universal stress protein [Pontibacter oryzae]|uniref:Universal stress protein n=1 Tax=Pontibacter oryzae TaxID=2304593 RepID=A0A399SD19_9BACT|nr:universal stress protein [Pontibacter oryzae]RIJ41610.1 universal stress protein [Pontibacter oryzae]
MLRILVLTDFSENAYAAMHTALQLARSYHAEVVFLHTMERPPVPATSPQEVYASIYESEHWHLEQKLQQECQKLYQELSIRPKEVLKTVQVLPAPLTDAVLQLSYSTTVNLVVMGSSGVSGFQKFFMGSNTSDMIRHTIAPLLIIPPNHTFNGFATISVIIRLKRFGERPGLKLLEKIAHTYSAKLYFVFVLDEDEMEPNYIQIADNQNLISNLPYEINSIRKANKSEDLERYLLQTSTQLLVWLPMQRGVWGNSPSEQFAERAASKAGLPLLVIPHIKEVQ